MQKKLTYKTPKVEVISIGTEKLCSTSEDPTITNPDMGWGARDKDLISNKIKFKSIWD